LLSLHQSSDSSLLKSFLDSLVIIQASNVELLPFSFLKEKIFKLKVQAVIKAGIKIERMRKDNRKIRDQAKKIISTFLA
jgi:hypothetical protein